MPRIRSIHPGLFTDEAFVSVSDAAQIFYIGLLTEADDQGVFEWKPLTLKMRLRPASMQPVDGLLAELVAVDRLAAYEVGGRKYGAIRNFRKFQRPKKPNAIHVLPDEFRTYVGLEAEGPEPDEPDLPPSSEPVPNQFPTGGEIPPQMEDGGDKREEVGKKESKSTAPPGAVLADLEFSGRVIRLKRADLDAWRRTYHAIPDIEAELRTLDAYYDAELVGSDRRKWFVRCSAALDKKHQAAVAARARPNGGLLPNEGVF